MGWRVTLQDNLKQFEVADAESLLEAALYQDVALPYGCQSGGCGACRARVVSGEVSYEYDPPALSPDEKAAGYVLLCQARAESDLIIQVQELPDHHAIQVRNIPVRVENKKLLCHDVMGLWLKLPKGEIFEYLPGQYLDFMLRDGRRRSFSIANAPENFRETGLLELHLRNVSGGSFTGHVFNDMPDRAMLRVEGPLGGFYLREDSEARQIILIAGGTGFAPVKAIIEHVVARKLKHRLHLYWGARTTKDLYQDEKVQQWLSVLKDFRYTPVLSEPLDTDSWQGRVGWLHDAVAADYADLSEVDVYASGPPPMIEGVKQKLFSQGLSTDRLYFDSFDYAFQTWPDKEAV